MPDDATEGVAEHSSRLQPSINLHAPVTAFMFSCSGIGTGNVEMKTILMTRIGTSGCIDLTVMTRRRQSCH